MIDTIFALSSGRPPAAIALIRISGPQALEINRKFTRSAEGWEERRARLVALRNPVDSSLLDRALALYFRAPHSATGEDVVEWQIHGGQAVIQVILAALKAEGTAREAQPGEFTRRAFENGKIDLNEAEGLADLLSAETESQRRAALAMAEGHFSRKVEQWRIDLLDLAARLEALLDFSDEGDVADQPDPEIAYRLKALVESIAHQLALPSAERLREGVRVVIAGPPNVGKSTLLNALVGREAAIVSDIAGTTRDRIEVPVSLGGYAFLLTDTAGLREESDDRIERIGMERAQSAIAAADIVLWLGHPAEAPREDALKVATQIDRAEHHVVRRGADLALSAVTGEGMAALVDWLVSKAKTIFPPDADYALHERQRQIVDQVYACVISAGQADDMLIAAEELRRARMLIDRLTGQAGVEDMLDSLFGRFCIGK